jgi:ATP-dependent 26S proteasome regulatory subunit
VKIGTINKVYILPISMVFVMTILSLTTNFPEQLANNLWGITNIVLIVSLSYSILRKIGLISDKRENINMANMEKDIKLSASIKRKHLYYNPREFRQILELTAILRQESFKKVQKHLSGNDMRKGFCCLFYGPPGTGKTESSYQIALETGRNIMAIDISDIQSMYPGESQKNIRSIFEKYRFLSEKSKEIPILLLNEADAIISKRTLIGHNPALEKDDNAMQNVLLQEMEDFDGILIATTNLTENFDKAFDRRFLYKIGFSMPDTNARTDIWQSIIPNLTEQEAHELAIKYKFSGGQIENIARKRIVESVLSGDNPSIERLKCYCQEEILSIENDKKIGFIA